MAITLVEVIGVAVGALTIVGIIGTWTLRFTRLDIMADVTAQIGRHDEKLSAKIDRYDMRQQQIYMPTAVLLEKLAAIDARLGRLESSSAPAVLGQLRQLLLELRNGTRSVSDE